MERVNDVCRRMCELKSKMMYNDNDLYKNENYDNVDDDEVELCININDVQINCDKMYECELKKILGKYEKLIMKETRVATD